jgi:hypothetical protein
MASHKDAGGSGSPCNCLKVFGTESAQHALNLLKDHVAFAQGNKGYHRWRRQPFSTNSETYSSGIYKRSS